MVRLHLPHHQFQRRPKHNPCWPVGRNWGVWYVCKVFTTWFSLTWGINSQGSTVVCHNPCSSLSVCQRDHTINLNRHQEWFRPSVICLKKCTFLVRHIKLTYVPGHVRYSWKLTSVRQIIQDFWEWTTPVGTDQKHAQRHSWSPVTLME